MICIGSVYEHDATDRWLNIRVLNLEELENVLQDNLNDIKFVFWLGVSNITGEIFPVKDIGYLCHKYNAFYICDATAMIGHKDISEGIDKWCDAFIMDGHKLGTELGIGVMWISDNLDKWLNGFKLHGTPNLAGALAMAQAVEEACDKVDLERKNRYIGDLFSDLANKLDNTDIEYCVVAPQNHVVPRTLAINAIRLPGFNARALQSYLASKEIYIGLGQSSCADKADRRVLCQGYGLSGQEADEVIRISFGEHSTDDDVKALVDNIAAFRKEYL